MTTSENVSDRNAAKATTSTSRFMASSFAFMMLSLATLAAAPARADHFEGTSLSHQVKLADLDLSTREGRRLADERLRQSARALCARIADELDLSHQSNYTKCVNSTVESAGARLQARLNQQSVATLARSDVK